MTELPNLSTWHRVPVGATVPKHMPYAYDYGAGPIVIEPDGYRFDTVVTNGVYYYTERPILPPLTGTPLAFSDKCPACGDVQRPCECGLL